ncbi:MAG TPA: TIGR03808 family TAT-translocated repetitive protein, partial [Xanthobacteraceae bacterium]
ANNIVDGAAVGVSVTNFKDHGGRLGVVQSNLIRNLRRGRPEGGDGEATGISAEADTVITGNVIETVKGTGIAAGWGPSLRDVTITGNLVRSAEVGIAVSVVQDAGTVVIANNLIADTPSGAIVGREWDKTVTGDLSKEGADRYVQLAIDGNRVR